MGLTTWSGKKIRKKDVTIAKNYLKETELKKLNRIVTMYLDYAEEQAENRKTMTMKNWGEKLNAFLKFNEKDILSHSGKVSENIAKTLAIEEYEKFKKKRQAIYTSIEELTQITKTTSTRKKKKKKISRKKK